MITAYCVKYLFKRTHIGMRSTKGRLQTQHNPEENVHLRFTNSNRCCSKKWLQMASCTYIYNTSQFAEGCHLHYFSLSLKQFLEVHGSILSPLFQRQISVKWINNVMSIMKLFEYLKPRFKQWNPLCSFLMTQHDGCVLLTRILSELSVTTFPL